MPYVLLALAVITLIRLAWLRLFPLKVCRHCGGLGCRHCRHDGARFKRGVDLVHRKR